MKKKKKTVGYKKPSYNLEISNSKETVFKDMVFKAIEWLQDGKPVSEIKQLIYNEKKGSRSASVIQSIVEHANLEIKNKHWLKQKDVLPIHIERYNRQIKSLIETKDIKEEDVDWGDKDSVTAFYNARNKKIRAYFSCIDSINQKEVLLQFHAKDFELNIEFEEKTIIEEKQQDTIGDINKLSFEEKLELLEYFKKTRESDINNLVSVKQLNEEEVLENTVDIEHVDVTGDNIKKIKIEQLPPPESPIKPTYEDAAAKLKEMVNMMAAAKKFKEAGFNLNEEEEKLIK